MDEQQTPEKKKSEEIDITDFFRVIGRGLTKFGQGLKWTFVALHDSFLELFIFLKKNLGWLLLGLVLGLGLGIYSTATMGPTYSTTMTVRSNIGNAYYLYNQVDYLNSLIGNQRIADLAKECNVTTDVAKTLKNFKIEPVKNEIEEAVLYRNTFFRFRRNHYLAFDTTFSKLIKFKDFQATLTDIDYPLQQITLYSHSQDVYPNVQQAFINSLNNNPEIKQQQQQEEEVQKEDEAMLANALKNLDTLRQVYNKKLELEASQPGGGNNQLVLGDRNPRNPELDLYDKSLMIKDELIEVRRKIDEQSEPIKLVSGFNKVGTQTSVVMQPIKYSLFGVALVFVILIMIEFYKYLTVAEKKSRPPTPQKITE